MRDQFSQFTKSLDNAVQEATALIDHAASETIKAFLKHLSEKYPNHTFHYVGEMGVRIIEVFRKDGKNTMSIDSDGMVDDAFNHCSSWRFSEHPIIQYIGRFMQEFEGSLNQNIYFDADSTISPSVKNLNEA